MKDTWDKRNPLPEMDHYGSFTLESIAGSSTFWFLNKKRIERGFLGAHADIGGGYAEGENTLSLVALNWMVKQASIAGVPMRAPPPLPTGSPVIHDQSTSIHVGNPNTVVDPSRNPYIYGAEDRSVNNACLAPNPTDLNGYCYTGTDSQRQQKFRNNSMTNTDTHQYINYTPRDIYAPNGSPELRQSTGTVKMNEYSKWLQSHGYEFWQ